jgi:hypothetical protein
MVRGGPTTRGLDSVRDATVGPGRAAGVDEMVRGAVIARAFVVRGAELNATGARPVFAGSR